MTNEEFSVEIKKYIDCYYGEFLAYKNDLSDMLSVFDTICKRNCIPYFLAYGTLLGAVRDGGSIPWDPDCDVCVAIKYIPQLIKALQSELPNEYFFQSNYTNKNFAFFQMRIGKKGYNLDYFHLDVFYMIGAPEDEKLDNFKLKIQKLYNQRFNLKQCKKKFLPIENKYKFLAKKIYYTLNSLFIFDGSLNRRFKKIINKYNYDNSTNLICFNGEACISVKHDVIEPVRELVLEKKSFSVPNKCDDYLNICYKNYHEYLPVEMRFREFYDWLRDYKMLSNQSKICNYRN